MLYSAFRQELSLAYFWLCFIIGVFERQLLYHFLSAHRQAILDFDWRRFVERCSCVSRNFTMELKRGRIPGPSTFTSPLHIGDRFLLKTYPKLITRDQVRLAELHDRHARFLREREDTPFEVFCRLVLAVEMIREDESEGWIWSGNEIQYFWRRGIGGFQKPGHWIYGGQWLVEDIPDPKIWLNSDPTRYALAACIAEQMADAFNWRVDRCLVRRDRWKADGWDSGLRPHFREKPPPWCADVPPSPKRRIVDEQKRKSYEKVPKDERAPRFAARNLVCKDQFLYFA